MENRLSPLIDPDRLRLEDDLVLIDVRTGPDARELYLAAHLAGACFADLNDDLAEIGPEAAIGPLLKFSSYRPNESRPNNQQYQSVDTT